MQQGIKVGAAFLYDIAISFNSMAFKVNYSNGNKIGVLGWRLYTQSMQFFA